jgi:hypothetical protein
MKLPGLVLAMISIAAPGVAPAAADSAADVAAVSSKLETLTQQRFDANAVNDNAF